MTEQIEQLISSLPTKPGPIGEKCLYNNFWYYKHLLPALFSFRSDFIAHDSDVILASKPKCGTTWLKALAFSTLRRSQFHPSDPNHPLASSNPHGLAPFLELELYANPERLSELTECPVPRLLSTHIPYNLLPDSIHRSNCRVIYICRNPLDMIVSTWHFLPAAQGNFSKQKVTIEDMVDIACSGDSIYGPFWNHILSFWKESKKSPHKVLFLKYEDLKEDLKGNLKKIANFMGVPFSQEEERCGVVEEIMNKCTLGNLKELEVNKSGSTLFWENKLFFRKGEVGDWVNYLSPSTADRVKRVMEEKFGPFGLTFKINASECQPATQTLQPN